LPYLQSLRGPLCNPAGRRAEGAGRMPPPRLLVICALLAPAAMQRATDEEKVAARAAALAAGRRGTNRTGVVDVIFDTDMSIDVDDVGGRASQ
jgi:hypothetical protein